MRPVVGAVHDDGIVGDTQVIQLLQQGADALVVVDHDVVVFRLPAAGLTRLSGLAWVRKCMCDVLNHTKKGLSALAWRSMYSVAAARTSSSMVSIRFLVNWPVSSMRPSAEQRSTPGVRSFS